MASPPEEAFLYLTTVGRTTGLARRIEIWYVEHAGRYYLCSERREGSGWVKNVAREPRVRFSVGPRGDEGAVVPESAATARALRDDAEPDLARAVRARFDEKYAWSEGLLVEIAPAE